MGLEEPRPRSTPTALTARIEGIKSHLQAGTTQTAGKPGRAHDHRHGAVRSPRTAEIETVDGLEWSTFDVALIATGSCRASPSGATPDGDRILTTRDCYPPKEFPRSITVVGSGVTGVEFVHMFSSFGAAVTLVVSRQQVLPAKDPEVAAVLEDDFLNRGVKLLKGARAIAIDRDHDRTTSWCAATTVGSCAQPRRARHRIGANSADLGLERAGVAVDAGGYVPIDHNCVTNVGHIYAAGDVSGKLPLSSVAAMQGRKVAERMMGLHSLAHRHLDYDKAALGHLHRTRDRRRRPGRDRGVRPRAARSGSPRCRSGHPQGLINNDPRGFVKIVSDPATGVVLGGSIVGRHAAE